MATLTLPASQESTVKPAPAARPALDALTGVRFLFAVYVIVYHVILVYAVAANEPRPEMAGFARWCAQGADFFSQTWYARGWSRCAYPGLTMFFVQSGFILTYTLQGWDGRVKMNRRDFAANRFARVYPLYFFALVLSFPYFLATTHRVGIGLLVTAIATLALAQAWSPLTAIEWNSPGWSLSAEVFFYVLFVYLIVRLDLLSRRALWTIAVAACLVVYIVPLVYMAVDPDGLGPVDWASEGFWLKAAKYNPLVRFPEFLLGMILGVLFGQQAATLAARRESRGGWAVAAALALFCVAQTFGDYIPYLIMHNALELPIMGLLIAGLALGGGPIGWILARRPLVYLGDCSYGLYILHVPVMTTGLIGIWLFTGGLEQIERDVKAKELAKQRATQGAPTVEQQSGEPTVGVDDSGRMPDIPAIVEKKHRVLTPNGFIALTVALSIVAAVIAHHLIEVPGRRFLRRKLGRRALPAPAAADLP